MSDLKPMFAYQGGKTKVASKIYETITDNHGDDITLVDVCGGCCWYVDIEYIEEFKANWIDIKKCMQ